MTAIPLTLSPKVGIFFAGVYISHEVASTHFCFVGATGSGKTASITLIMKTTLPFIGINQRAKSSSGKEISYHLDHRALIYDAKQDTIPTLKSLNLNCEVKNLNPFAKDSCAWDMARDIRERAHAGELAAILCPPEPNAHQRFFTDAAIGLLEGVITSFMLNTPDDWTFRDLIYAMSSKERIIEVLSNHNETQELIPRYFGNQETANNIMSTIETRLRGYKVVAALWENAKDKVSLKEWLDGKKKFILVLGNDETAREAIDRINQAIFNRAAQLILAQPDIDRKNEIVDLGGKRIVLRRHWIFLDELGDAGRLPKLPSLMVKGRSKGACIVLGFQDIEGLQAVYGDKEANALVGQCSNYGIFRLQSPKTAEWASNVLGGRGERLERHTDKSFAEVTGESYRPGFWNDTELQYQNSETNTVNEKVASREVTSVYPFQFLDLEPAEKINALHGFYRVPHLKRKNFEKEIPGTYLFDHWLKSNDQNVGGSHRSYQPYSWQDSWQSYEYIPTENLMSWRRENPNEQKLEPWSYPSKNNKQDHIGVTDYERLKLDVKKRQLFELKATFEQMMKIALNHAELCFYEDRDATEGEMAELGRLGLRAKTIFIKHLAKLRNEYGDNEDETQKAVNEIEKLVGIVNSIGS